VAIYEITTDSLRQLIATSFVKAGIKDRNLILSNFTNGI